MIVETSVQQWGSAGSRVVKERSIFSVSTGGSEIGELIFEWAQHERQRRPELMTDIAEEGCLGDIQFGQLGIRLTKFADRCRQLVTSIDDLALHLLSSPTEHFTHLACAYELGDILNPMQDVGHVARRIKDRNILRAPVTRQKLAIRPSDVVLLNWHGVGLPGLQHPIERGAQIAGAGSRRIVGIVGKDLEEPATEALRGAVRNT